jgi:ubiquinone/menaquinone biosynthesis C-methylase UbiE
MPEITSTKLSIDPSLLPAAGARVIDIGCGDGRHLRAAAARGCITVGIDYDLAGLRATQRRLRTTHNPQPTTRHSLIAADAAHLPFRDASFDAAICTETLEHLPDDRAPAREIARVLVDGAPLLGAVPTHFTERLYWALSRGYRNTPGGHVRIYTPRAIVDTLRAAGLRVDGIRYAHFVDSIVWLRFCLTDFLRPMRPNTDFEAAVLLAIAEERPTPTWRTNLRRALARSRFIAALDAAGALVWPKSLLFTARKVPSHASAARHDGVASSQAARAAVDTRSGR